MLGVALVRINGRGNPLRVAGATLLAGVLVLTGCSDTSKKGTTAAGDTQVAPAQVTITPAQGTKKARPDQDVVVKATGGALESVNLQLKGKAVPGDFNAQKTEWRSRWTLRPASTYTVNATAKNSAGAASQAASTFRTFKPDATFAASLDWILEGNQGKDYGVGMPIILDFDRAVHNKAEVEKALEVKAEKPVEGAWRWMGHQKVIYRPKTYWQPHQKVTLTARLAGVRAAKGLYGMKDLTRTFEIGQSRITKVDLKKHKMTVTVDGKKARTVKVSGGNASTMEYTTSSGVHMTMEKDNPVRMVSPGRKKGDPGYYDELIGYAVRISSRGEYLHQTSGEEWCLGKQNCSHGCVRQPTKDAVWFYNNVQPGDIVDIKGTKRKLDYANGWSYWQLSWTKWKQGSALQ
ncbi:Ig-like domain-containing protein [Actinomadura sp. 9N407]|uniref:L,D-transpeptidase n=1 Tax=Actinomadura sp. 9N407 TaxID=3375154 RepID=UPI0037B3C03E